MLPKGFSNFLKNPDMPKLACVAIAVFLAILILRYFKVIEGMASDLMSDTEGYGPKKEKHSGPHSDKMTTMMDPTKLMEKIGLK